MMLKKIVNDKEVLVFIKTSTSPKKMDKVNKRSEVHKL